MRRIAPHSVAMLGLVAIMAGCGPMAPAHTAVTGNAPIVSVNATPMQLAIPTDKGALSLDVALADAGAAPGAYHVASLDAIASWFKDIDHIDFKVTVDSLPNPIIASIKKSQFLNNKAVLQINNLPPGHVTIHASALDAGGKSVVEADGDGAIQPNTIATINLICAPHVDAGLGNVRIEMNCWAECACEEPTPAPTAFVPDPLAIVTFKSYGDPHEEGGNGLQFDNMMRGTFLAIQTLTKDVLIEKNQDIALNGKWAGRPVNNAFAIKSKDDTFLYYLYGARARMNGKAVTIADGGQVSGTSGLVVSRKGTAYTITTAAGDVVNLDDKGCFLNMDGKISGDRTVHEVRGSLGTFNNQTSQEALIMRDGTKAPDLKGFLMEWAVRGDENLFPMEEPFVPANYQAPSPAPTPAAPIATPTPAAAKAATPAPTPVATPTPAGPFTGYKPKS